MTSRQTPDQDDGDHRATSTAAISNTANNRDEVDIQEEGNENYDDNVEVTEDSERTSEDEDADDDQTDSSSSSGSGSSEEEVIDANKQPQAIAGSTNASPDIVDLEDEDDEEDEENSDMAPGKAHCNSTLSFVNSICCFVFFILPFFRYHPTHT